MKGIHIVLISIFFLLVSSISAVAVPGKAFPAKAAVVMDSTGTVLFSKYPNARLAPASTVKLVTAMVAIDILKPEDVVTISKYASRTKTIPPGICPEEELAVSDLLHLALMKSINSAAVALAEAAGGTEDDFVVLMNRKAQEIGARDTLFANASGLPKGTQYSTANDLALIMKTALSYPLIREILATKAYLIRTAAGREIFLENSNHLLWEDQAMIIGKTGYTGNARHCFVGAMDTGNGTVITAVLGARSRHSLWRATEMLAEIGIHPELAQLLEASPGNRGSGRPSSRKSKAVTAGVGKELAVQDSPKSWMLRGFPQQLNNN
ncbi:MAG: D-alanyl-D-alanine carboxypeptidase family protein [Nitrospirota bacterium]